MTRPFAKPALAYAEQVDLLRTRGMVIEDLERAEFRLEHLNYYRLCAYWLPFEADHASHQFRAGTRFSDVLDLYEFDRELRLLVLDAIERVEVSVRAHWAYHLSHRHGPHAHLDRQLARDQQRWRSDMKDLNKAVRISREVFIEHLTRSYNDKLPPVWAVCEVMSLGSLSKWYANLKPKATRRAIARSYGIDHVVLQSWLHHISQVRNVCAHHGRLWNREFTITPKQPRTKPVSLGGQFAVDSRKVYNALVILLHLMDVISPGHEWRKRLRELLAREGISKADMGFPKNWESFGVWGEVPS